MKHKNVNEMGCANVQSIAKQRTSVLCSCKTKSIVAVLCISSFFSHHSSMASWLVDSLKQAFSPGNMDPAGMSSSDDDSGSEEARRVSPNSEATLAAVNDFASEAAAASSQDESSIDPVDSSASSVVLDFPHDHLDASSGQVPATEEKAKRLWPWRKNRPALHSVNSEDADGKKMLKEAKAIREDLKQHVIRRFCKEAREMAKIWGLRVPSTQDCPKTREDFGDALASLEWSEENEKIVHFVMHNFHHHKSWLADVVDEWCKLRNCRILLKKDKAPDKVVEGRAVKARKVPFTRGGFGAAARAIENEIVRTRMNNMIKSAGWCVADKCNGQGAPGKVHETVNVVDQQTRSTHSFCRVKRVSADEVVGASNL